MSSSLVLVDRQDPTVTVLTLNRPEKRNALNIELMDEFCRAFTESEKLPDQRVIIIKSAGSIFCAGLDLAEAANPSLVKESSSLLSRLFTTIYNSPIISVAAVQGAAIAGGAGIASACDFVVAAEDAKFGYPEVHRGLVAALVSTLLRRQIGQRHVRELLLLGEMIDASRALEIGLINQIVKSEELSTKADELAALVLKGSSNAVKETKLLLTNLELISLADDLIIASAVHHRSRLSVEARNGVNHFLDLDRRVDT